MASPLDLLQSGKIHPVLVVYDELIGIQAVRQLAQTQFDEAIALDDILKDKVKEKVGALLILTVDEVELLEALSHTKQVEKLLGEFAEYVAKHSNDRGATFRSFLTNHGYTEVSLGGRPRINQMLNRLANDVSDLMKRGESEEGK
jgi:hypothetical protein